MTDADLVRLCDTSDQVDGTGSAYYFKQGIRRLLREKRALQDAAIHARALVTDGLHDAGCLTCEYLRGVETSAA